MSFETASTLYLAHRYQVEAVSKLIGGVHYTYTVKGFETSLNEDWKVTPVADQMQQDALQALLETINPRFLEIPASIRALIPPPPIGFNRDRETFSSDMGLVFDPFAAAESAADNTLRFLLNPQRLARLIEQKAADPGRRMSVRYVFGQLRQQAFTTPRETAYREEIAWMVEKLFLKHLIALAADKSDNQQRQAQPERRQQRVTQEIGNRGGSHSVFSRSCGPGSRRPDSSRQPGRTAES